MSLIKKVIVMRNIIYCIVSLILTIFIFVGEIYAAEILQITNSSSLIIGDNNRSYQVKLYCSDVPPENEEKAIDYLKKILPRKTKINIKPRGFEDGKIVASVVTLKKNLDVVGEMKSKNLSIGSC